MLTKSKPEDAKRLWAQAQHDAETRFAMYEYLAQRRIKPDAEASVQRRDKSAEEPALVGAGKEVRS